MKITELSAAELKKELSCGNITSADITKAYLSRIAKEDNSIGAYITVTADMATKAAENADKALGEAAGSLAGIPCAIKDNICTKGVLTTCASKMLAGFKPPYSATAADILLNQNASPLLGKTNMDEFAMGSTTESSYFKVTKNPADITRVPGGSSGGSAAAVAAGLAPFALGSDTGGSIRQPAAFCGVVGMKPTYGAVSRYGLIAFASSLDQIGPITKNVYDAAMVSEQLCRYDSKDATSVSRDYSSFTKDIATGISGKRVALPREFFGGGLNPEIKAAILAAAKQLEALGARVEEVSMPRLESALPAYYVISGAEASSNLARFDGVKYGFRAENATDIDDMYKKTRTEGFGEEVKRRIMLGSFALSSGYYDEYYQKALKVRTLIIEEYKKVFSEYDLILSPVAPTTAYPLGEKTQSPLEMYMGDIYTVPVNIAGLPAISIPCAKDSAGLPIGLQLIAPHFEEAELFKAAYALEQAIGEVQ